MTEPSPKRRRTTGSPEPPSPSKSAYASFQSPTKASLARFNPALLPASRSSPARKLPPGSTRKPRAGSIDPLSYVLQGKAKNLPASEPANADDYPEDELNESVGSQQAGKDDEATEAGANTPSESIPRMRPSTRNKKLIDDDNADDLPETPQHLRERPEYQDTPPRGVLFHSTPTKRPSRSGKKATERHKTQLNPIEAAADATGPPAKDQTGAVKQTSAPQLTIEEKAALRDRQVELDGLRKDLSALKADIAELERHSDQVENWKDDQNYADLPSLIFLINETNPNSRNTTGDAASVSTLLSSFLPFAIPIPDSSAEKVDEEPVPSHAPLPDEPQLLSLFTPFKVSSTISRPSVPSEPEDPILQLHTIHLSSPSSIISCAIALTVASGPAKPQGPIVDTLTVNGLTPWVEREIGSWVRSRAEEGDIVGLGYGLGRYWDMIIKRAKAWAEIQQAYPDLHPRATGISGNVNAQHHARRPNKGKRKVTNDVDALDIRELKQLFGCEMLVLGDERYQVSMYWQFSFDWTSEIQSKLSIKLAFPQSGSASVEAKTLTRNTTNTFRKLVRRYGVNYAVKTIVGTIYGNV